MLRVKDAEVSLKFYTEHFGFTLLRQSDFPQWNFSLIFLAILPEGMTWPDPKSEEALDALWKYEGVVLELTHNHGTENDENFKVNNGNEEPHRGFGHIAVMTKDVEEDCVALEENGVQFRKRPNEGMMKGLAFALDPDGYWIEIIRREQDSPINNKYTFAQTMLRVKDPVKSVAFYRDIMGMNLCYKSDHAQGKFSNYFMTHAAEDSAMKMVFEPVIELTHNHGTEDQADFKYHNGNTEDEDALRGFGHTGFLVDDLDGACEWLEQQGVTFKKKPTEGNMRNIAFAYDPDGYWVEIIDRGMKISF